jgi:hypothetical protein
MDLGLALATEPNRTGPSLETEQVLWMGKVAHMDDGALGLLMNCARGVLVGPTHLNLHGTPRRTLPLGKSIPAG